MNETQVNEMDIYNLFQPTGLLYGKEIQLPNFIRDHKFNQKESSLALIASAYVFINQLWLDYRNEGLLSIVSYFDIFCDTRINEQNINILTLEKLFERYLFDKTNYSSNREKAISLSLIFFDIIAYNNWLKSGKRFSKDRYDYELIQVIKLVISCLKVDGISKEEKDFLTKLLSILNLKQECINELQTCIDSPKKLEVDFSIFETTLFKKYVLEQCILVSWFDFQVSKKEIKFFETVAEKIQLPKEELDRSSFAVECFMLKNYTKLPELSTESKQNQIASNIKNRVSKFFDKNKKRIIQEVNESKELVDLMNKSRKQKLTDEEKKKVKTQLLDILKIIPSFTIFILPFGSIILPILLKIIPNHLLLPSSFIDEKKEE
jgi:hypothetical protein